MSMFPDNGSDGICYFLPMPFLHNMWIKHLHKFLYIAKIEGSGKMRTGFSGRGFEGRV
jgi:hypothetical protein